MAQVGDSGANGSSRSSHGPKLTLRGSLDMNGVWASICTAQTHDLLKRRSA